MTRKLYATEIAQAFNSATDRKSWTARANSRPQTGMDLVHFSARTGLISIVYNTVDERFHVRFNKFQAAWGDYVKSIANSLYYVLTTLKMAGLPFEAPDSPEGIIIEATNTAGAHTYVRWPAPPEPIDPVMPELALRDYQRSAVEFLTSDRKLMVAPALGKPYGGALGESMQRQMEENIDAILEDWPDAPEPDEPETFGVDDLEPAPRDDEPDEYDIAMDNEPDR